MVQTGIWCLELNSQISGCPVSGVSHVHLKTNLEAHGLGFRVSGLGFSLPGCRKLKVSYHNMGIEWIIGFPYNRI